MSGICEVLCSTTSAIQEQKEQCNFLTHSLEEQITQTRNSYDGHLNDFYLRYWITVAVLVSVLVVMAFYMVRLREQFKHQVERNIYLTRKLEMPEFQERMDQFYEDFKTGSKRKQRSTGDLLENRSRSTSRVRSPKPVSKIE
jgi:predicted PurR-regulated permease PerM